MHDALRCVCVTCVCVSPQVSPAAAAVSPGSRGRKSFQVLQDGWHPDIIMLNGTRVCACVCINRDCADETLIKILN